MERLSGKLIFKEETVTQGLSALRAIRFEVRMKRQRRVWGYRCFLPPPINSLFSVFIFDQFKPMLGIPVRARRSTSSEQRSLSRPPSLRGPLKKVNGLRLKLRNMSR